MDKKKKEISGADTLCSYVTGGTFFTLCGIVLNGGEGRFTFGGSLAELAGDALMVFVYMAIQAVAGVLGKALYEGIARNLFPDKQNYAWNIVRGVTVFALTLAAVYMLSFRK